MDNDMNAYHSDMSDPENQTDSQFDLDQDEIIKSSFIGLEKKKKKISTLANIIIEQEEEERNFNGPNKSVMAKRKTLKNGLISSDDEEEEESTFTFKVSQKRFNPLSEDEQINFSQMKSAMRKQEVSSSEDEEEAPKKMKTLKSYLDQAESSSEDEELIGSDAFQDVKKNYKGKTKSRTDKLQQEKIRQALRLCCGQAFDMLDKKSKSSYKKEIDKLEQMLVDEKSPEEVKNYVKKASFVKKDLGDKLFNKSHAFAYNLYINELSQLKVGQVLECN